MTASGTLDPPAAVVEDGGHRRLRRDVPAWLLVVAFLVLAVNMVMSVAGARTASVSADEPVHVSRMQSWLDHGWYLPADQLSDGQPDAVGMGYVYGPATALPGHWLAQLTGAEDRGSVASTPEAYDARRTVINLLSFAGLAAVGALGWLALGTWRWGVVAASMLAAIPMWTGHAMFNIKDMPVAAGYTILTAGLAGVVAARRRPGYIAAGAAVAAGTFVAVGTRPGMWMAVVLGVATLLVGLLVARVPRRHIGNALVTVVAGVVAAYVGLVVLYPNVFASPVEMALQSLGQSSEFPAGADTTQLTAGITHNVRQPWFAVPVWFAAQTPFVIAIFAAMGLLGAAVLAWRLLRTRGDDVVDDRDLVTRLTLVVVSVQALALPLAAIAKSSVIYSGVRQLMFVVPAIAVFAAFGLRRTLDWSSLRHRRWWRPAVYGAAAVGMVLPTIDQARLFPYGYTYFNGVATLRPITGNWATDYWKVSTEELTESALPHDPETERLVISGMWRGQPIPPGCRLASEVTRPLRWREVLMQWAAICPVPTYPVAGINFGTGGNGVPFRSGPWSSTPTGVTTRSSGAGVVMLLPERFRGLDLVLTLTGRRDPATDPTDVEVFANGRIVGTLSPTPESRPARFRIPADVITDSGRLQIDLRSPGGEERLGFELQRLELRALQ